MARSPEGAPRHVSARRYQPLLEGLALLAVTFPLAVGLHLSTLWFVAPFARHQPSPSGRTPTTALTPANVPGSIGFHAVVIGSGLHPVHHRPLPAARTGGSARTSRCGCRRTCCARAVDQVLLIGLPEEFFFRGYLQTQFDQVWERPYRFFGAAGGSGCRWRRRCSRYATFRSATRAV